MAAEPLLSIAVVATQSNTTGRRQQWLRQWMSKFSMTVSVPRSGGHTVPSFTCAPQAIWIEDRSSDWKTIMVFPSTELYQVSAQIIQVWWRCSASKASRRSAVRNLMWGIWLIKMLRGIINLIKRNITQPNLKPNDLT